MLPGELAAVADWRLQQKWYALIAAEQQGLPVQMLERLFSAYLVAVDDYNCAAACQFVMPVANPVARKTQPLFSEKRAS